MDLRTALSINFTRNLLLLALLGGGVGVQAATMYKWVDEEGHVHYDQSPPNNRSSETIKSHTGVEGQPPQESAAEETDQTGIPTPTEDKNSRIKQQNCISAKRNKAIYKENNKIRQPDGTEIVLSEEMRAEKLRQVEEDIKKYCQ